MVLRKEAERCTRCRRRGWRRSSEALRRRCRRPALCGPLAGILLLVTARHGDPRRRVPPRRRRDPQLRRHFRFGWAGTQDGASQACNLQLRSPETGTHAYGTYWRGPTLTVRGPTVAIPPERDRAGGARAEQGTWGLAASGGLGVSSSLLGLVPGRSRSRRRLLTPGAARGPGWAAQSLPEQGLSALPGLCGPVRPRQSTQAAPHPLCWMGSMVWAASRGRRRPVRRAGACSGVTAGLAQPSRAALRI